jgi:hypothetical protein
MGLFPGTKMRETCLDVRQQTVLFMAQTQEEAYIEISEMAQATVSSVEYVVCDVGSVNLMIDMDMNTDIYDLFSLPIFVL